MDYLSIKDLKIDKFYDIKNNNLKGYLIFFVDEKGRLFQYDTVVKCNSSTWYKYNEAIELEFFEINY